MNLSEELQRLNQQFNAKREAKAAAIEKQKALKDKSYKQACEECQTLYHPTRYWQRFCSDACRYANRVSVTPQKALELEAENQMLLEEVDRLKARIAELEA